MMRDIGLNELNSANLSNIPKTTKKKTLQIMYILIHHQNQSWSVFRLGTPKNLGEAKSTYTT